MGSVGLYFGTKVISVVETKGKNLANSILIPQALASGSDLEEKVPTEAKIVALLKEELRKNNIAASEVCLALSGRDLIIRTFDLPALPKSELPNAINFEVRKYIPFKVEGLVSDFQVHFDHQARTNSVLFVAVKRETLDNYISAFRQMNLKLVALEYSAFSLLRLMKLAGENEKGIVGLLAADAVEGDEVNFVVSEAGIPLFSRDIYLSEAPGVPEKPAAGQAEEMPVLEKLKTEVRVSLDYFHRKFPAKELKKVYLACPLEHRAELEAVVAEMGLSLTYIDMARVVKKAVPFSLSFFKGYAVSLAGAVATDLKINLLSVREKPKVAPIEEMRPKPAEAKEPFRLDLKMVFLGLVICAAAFGVGQFYQVKPARTELDQAIAMRPQVSSVTPQASYSEINEQETELRAKLNALDILVKKQLYVTKVLSILPKSLPEGIWFKDFSLKKSANEVSFTLSGVAFLSDAQKELAAVNEFVSRLKSNSEFSNYFKQINLDSISQGSSDKIQVTAFIITCENRQ